MQEVQPDCRATARDGRTGEYGFPGTGGCPLSVLPTKSRGPTDGLRRAAASRLLGAEGDDGESGTILTQENWDFLFESRGFRVFPGMIPIRAAHTLSCPPELNGGSVNSTQGSQHPDSNLSGEFRGSSCTWAPRSPRALYVGAELRGSMDPETAPSNWASVSAPQDPDIGVCSTGRAALNFKLQFQAER